MSVALWLFCVFVCVRPFCHDALKLDISTSFLFSILSLNISSIYIIFTFQHVHSGIHYLSNLCFDINGFIANLYTDHIVEILQQTNTSIQFCARNEHKKERKTINSFLLFYYTYFKIICLYMSAKCVHFLKYQVLLDLYIINGFAVKQRKLV